jgi:lactate racemase
MPTHRLLFGRQGLTLSLPPHTRILKSTLLPALPNPQTALHHALQFPIASSALSQLLAKKNPRTVAITISDITRPVPNQLILPALLDTLAAHGISDSHITIIVGTGLHRPSTPEEKVELVGPEILRRINVIDHRADAPETLLRIADNPPVSVNKIFAEADFRSVTGLIEPHFMAGYSGGRKGICPALVDLQTIQRFHGHAIMGDPHSASGILENNPCHAESLRIARIIGADFLLNVAINDHRQITGIYAGDLEAAHAAGIADVQRGTSALVESPADLVITCAGGYPLDQTFYQSVKGMVAALPACHKNSTLLILSDCYEGIGSASYQQIMFDWSNRWQEFLHHITTAPVQKDQWQAQLHTRVLNHIGQERLHFATDALPPETLSKLWVTPLPGTGPAAQRAQYFIDGYLRKNPAASLAMIPEGPYTLLRPNL